MTYEQIPEDKEQSYPCPTGCGGNVKRTFYGWQCDNCDFEKSSWEE